MKYKLIDEIDYCIEAMDNNVFEDDNTVRLNNMLRNDIANVRERILNDEFTDTELEKFLEYITKLKRSISF